VSSSFLPDIAKQSVAQALVVAIDGTDVMLAFGDDLQEVMPADVLQTSEGPMLRLETGDFVLACRLGEEAKRAIVLGRIGAYRPAVGATPVSTIGQNENVPDTLVLEARESLTLRVGDGSITIRADGKILIKGKDLVSHAQRMNRIKGGSVAIN
jgi:hypothetical protein